MRGKEYLFDDIWHMEMCSSFEKFIEACQYLTFVYSLSNPLGKGFNGEPEPIKNTQKFSMSGAYSYNSVQALHMSLGPWG